MMVHARNKHQHKILPSSKNADGKNKGEKRDLGNFPAKSSTDGEKEFSNKEINDLSRKNINERQVRWPGPGKNIISINIDQYHYLNQELRIYKI